MTGNHDVRVARAFHDATAHTPASIRTSGHTLEWDIKPFPFKVYTDLPTISLPPGRFHAPATARRRRAPRVRRGGRRARPRPARRDHRAQRALLAKHLEVSGAWLAPSLLGLRHDAGEPHGRRSRPRSDAASPHRLRGCRRQPFAWPRC